MGKASFTKQTEKERISNRKKNKRKRKTGCASRELCGNVVGVGMELFQRVRQKRRGHLSRDLNKEMRGAGGSFRKDFRERSSRPEIGWSWGDGGKEMALKGKDKE